MSIQPIIFLSAPTAPKRCHFAVPAQRVAASASNGKQASLRLSLLPMAEAVERFCQGPAHSIVPSRGVWLANSHLPHRPLRPLWEQA